MKCLAFALLVSLWIAPVFCRAATPSPVRDSMRAACCKNRKISTARTGCSKFRSVIKRGWTVRQHSVLLHEPRRDTVSPTLHVHPGDHLVIHLKNDLTPNGTMPSKQSMPAMAVMGNAADVCGAMMMNSLSVNLHAHGTNLPPICHQDEVIKTIINPGETFDYDMHFPTNEPPGLYWYHPHIHGISEPAVLGGASGTIIVEGLENANPAVSGLPEHVFVVRDNLVPGNPTPGGTIPSWDISVNYVPVPYPTFTPAKLQVKPNRAATLASGERVGGYDSGCGTRLRQRGTAAAGSRLRWSAHQFTGWNIGRQERWDDTHPAGAGCACRVHCDYALGTHSYRGITNP